MHGNELLASMRAVYPLARRVLLTAYSDIVAAVKAINEAHVDHYLSKPWDPPDEKLYPVVDDLLDTWQVESLPESTGLRLLGHQWSPRSHAIKDFLAGNLIPYRWLDVERDAGTRSTICRRCCSTTESCCGIPSRGWSRSGSAGRCRPRSTSTIS
jgi:thioredoxin reductase (NADPH)